MRNSRGQGKDPVVFVQAGQRFGRLVVVEPEVRKYFPSVPAGIRAAICCCDCGQQRTVTLMELAKGGTRSCGCLHADQRAERFTRHGMSGHPLYATHHAIMQRCYLPGHVHYRNYGGRGIIVCQRWHDVGLFIGDIERWLGPRPPGLTLDRICNDHDYRLDNVRWATRSEQRRNQRKQEKR